MSTENKTEVNIFEVALRNNFRYPTPRGPATTEDLYGLNVEQLDATFKTLNEELKKADTESLLTSTSAQTRGTSAKIAVVKHIVFWKLAKAKKAAEAKEKAEKKQELMQLYKEAQSKALGSKAPEEILAMLNALDAETED